jgi:hypothetical protein
MSPVSPRQMTDATLLGRCTSARRAPYCIALLPNRNTIAGFPASLAPTHLINPRPAPIPASNSQPTPPASGVQSPYAAESAV